MTLSRTEGKDGPGSYTAGEPFDTVNATLVPLRTPHGPVTFCFTDDGHVHAESGYQEREYNWNAELFTWKDRGVQGSAEFWRETGWLPRLGHRGETNLTARKRAYGQSSLTDKMERDIIAYWSVVIKRYVAENPHIPAHAAFRSAVRSLDGQDKAIAEAEQELTRMRKERRGTRQQVRRTFITRAAVSMPGALDSPRPWPHETVIGYVVELENDRGVHQVIKAQRTARNEQEK